MRRDKHMWTDEQVEYIKRIAKGRLNKEIADMVNRQFGLSITARQINTIKKNRGITSEVDTRFQKGQKPWNKGTKGLTFGGTETQFQKGQTPYNLKPIGSERVDAKDGYTLIKVSNEGRYQDKWRFKHQVIWEEAYGKIPEGYILIFLNQDKTDIRLDNLKLIKRSTLLRMNRTDLFFEDADLTETGSNVAELQTKMYERINEH